MNHDPRDGLLDDGQPADIPAHNRLVLRLFLGLALALVAALFLIGCGGGSDIHVGAPDHYDRYCPTVFPNGTQCATCGGASFACGGTCIPESRTCADPPGCACNSFRIQ